MEIKKRRHAIADQDKYYYTGKSCCHGHVTKRRTSNGHCCMCDKQYREQWMKDNPHKKQEYSDRYKESRQTPYYKELNRLRQQKRRNENPEKNREYMREYMREYNKTQKGNAAVRKASASYQARQKAKRKIEDNNDK